MLTSVSERLIGRSLYSFNVSLQIFITYEGKQ
jgi:hypothetical protein